jgi:hypothetical protein
VTSSTWTDGLLTRDRLQAFGVEVPETDYRKLLTLDDCVTYLAARVKPA